MTSHFGWRSALRKCCRVLSRVGAQDHKIGVHPFHYAPAVDCVAEALGRFRSQRFKNVLETHACAGHPDEFIKNIELFDLAYIRAEQDLSARFRIGP
jgi:hypothetical protein